MGGWGRGPSDSPSILKSTPGTHINLFIYLRLLVRVKEFVLFCFLIYIEPIGTTYYHHLPCINRCRCRCSRSVVPPCACCTSPGMPVWGRIRCGRSWSAVICCRPGVEWPARVATQHAIDRVSEPKWRRSWCDDLGISESNILSRRVWLHRKISINGYLNTDNSTRVQCPYKYRL